MALQLSSRAAPCLKAARIGSGSRVARQAVVVRAKELREFREDTGEVVNAGDKAKASQQGNGGLYADQVPAAARRKDNMSKEMKARLRQEYIGFGGAENKAMSSNYFLWIAVVVAVLAVMSKMIGAI